MKENFSLFPIIFWVVVISGVACERISEPGPKEILSRYINANQHGQFEEAYELVSSDDKAIKSLESYLSEAKGEILSITFSYQIEEVTITGDRANASVLITVPDFSAIFPKLLGTAFLSALGVTDSEQLAEKLAEKYPHNAIPRTTKSETFHLLKENDGWKMFLDWKSEKIKAEKEAKVKALLAEAEKLKKQNKLHGALKKYEEVLELDSEVIEAQEGMQETKRELAEFKEKQEHVKYNLSFAF